ncbi:MAG: TIGR00725 family protein [Thermoplasmatota archaeon]
MKTLIAVSGSGGKKEKIPEDVLSLAEELGFYIAKQQAVLVTGGRGGVMEAACRGAKKGDGITLGILPNEKGEANDFVDIAVGTGLSFQRNFLIAQAADCMICLAGGWGTLSEISAAFILEKPVVFVKSVFGMVDKILNADIIPQDYHNYAVADTAKDAVELACGFIK